MKLAVSNIAWDAGEDAAIAEVLARHAVRGLEVAPTKVWERPAEVGAAAVERYRRRWRERGIEIVAMQSLLFGQPDLELFNGPEARQRTLAYLSAIIRLGGWLGARALVFGSPKSRALHGMSRVEALEVAVEFFARVAEVAARHGTTVCLEPNPAAYGCEFAQTTAEALDVVRRVDRPGFGLQLDTGSLAMAGEVESGIVADALPWIRHVHVSEPQLGAVGSAATDHRRIAEALARLGYGGWLSIEMRSGQGVSNAQAVDEALRYVRDVYRASN
jgi:sugar phosphate isomerase/epimerase